MNEPQTRQAPDTTQAELPVAFLYVSCDAHEPGHLSSLVKCLPEQLREGTLCKHYSLKTEQTCVYRVRYVVRLSVEACYPITRHFLPAPQVPLPIARPCAFAILARWRASV